MVTRGRVLLMAAVGFMLCVSACSRTSATAMAAQPPPKSMGSVSQQVAAPDDCPSAIAPQGDCTQAPLNESDITIEGHRDDDGYPYCGGIDLIGTVGAPQTICGKIRKRTSILEVGHGLEKRCFRAFACDTSSKQWNEIPLLGETKTGEDGRFAVTVAGDHALKAGLTRLHLSVDGSPAGSNFVALISDKNSKIAVSDVDGTLTKWEDPVAHGETTGDVQPNAGAKEALQELVSANHYIIYLTARAEPVTATEETRWWLNRSQFPEGPIRQRLLSNIAEEKTLSPVAFKMSALKKIADPMKQADPSFVFSAGIGNQTTDQQAYSESLLGFSPQRIFIVKNDTKRPAPLKDTACVFDDYGSLLKNKFDPALSGAIKCAFPPLD